MIVNSAGIAFDMASEGLKVFRDRDRDQDSMAFKAMTVQLGENPQEFGPDDEDGPGCQHYQS